METRSREMVARCISSCFGRWDGRVNCGAVEMGELKGEDDGGFKAL